MTDQTKVLAAGNGSGLGKAQHSNNSAAQRRRLLQRLEAGPVTTLEARRELDILMPAARVFELRALGYLIVTYRVIELTDCGKEHNVARYALNSSPANDGDGASTRPDSETALRAA